MKWGNFRHFITVLFWNILKFSKVIKIWHKGFLVELLYDLEVYELEPERIRGKYLEMLERAKAR